MEVDKMTIGENYQFYAQLSIRNSTLTNPSIGDQYELIMSNSETYSIKLLDIKNNTQTGYQGYLYQNLETGELYIVHSGSQSLDPGDAPLSDQNRSEVMNDIYKR